MKTKFLMACVLLATLSGCAHSTEAGKELSATPNQSPFYSLYPSDLAPAAEAYFGEWNKVLFKKGPLDTKAARLAAISASAAMKCEYCITAQVILAKAEARPTMRSRPRPRLPEVARFPVLLYGNEFSHESSKASRKMTQKPAACCAAEAAVLKLLLLRLTGAKLRLAEAAKAAEAAAPAGAAKPADAGPKKSPFYSIPADLAPAAEALWRVEQGPLQGEPLDTKATTRCRFGVGGHEVRVLHHRSGCLAKVAGASDDEIKAATQIAAEVTRFSVLLYGNEFCHKKLKAILNKMTAKAAK